MSIQKKRKQPEWLLMFGGVWSASTSVAAMWDRSCGGIFFSMVFAVLSMAAFAELFDKDKETP